MSDNKDIIFFGDSLTYGYGVQKEKSWVYLIGNISTMDDEPYIHLHVSAADQNNIVFGGHLNEAYISATAEIVINIIETKVDRIKNRESGLNIFKF